MAYKQNLRSATQRHFRDADLLFKEKRFDGAGYHYGLSAECALKSAMKQVGISEDTEVNDRPAVFLHFPELKRIPTKCAGRLSQTIAKVLARPQFLQEWNVRMRYSHDNAVLRTRCEGWRDQVREFNNSCLGI
jgi:hypothetical protein